MPLMRRGPGLIGTAAGPASRPGLPDGCITASRQRWADQDQQAYAEQAPPSRQPAAPAAPAAGPDYATELAKLAQLRDQGVITAEDFEAKKKQILGI